MNLINLPNFMHSLATWMVTQCAAQSPVVTINYTGAGARGLWRNKAIETPTSGIADPYSVLRPFGGIKPGYDPRTTSSIQCMSTSPTSEDAALLQASALYQTLFYPRDDDQNAGRALRSITITGLSAADNNDDEEGNWFVSAFDPGPPPGKVGVDERGRPLIVFNFEVSYCRA
jgi:hypothetical protein